MPKSTSACNSILALIFNATAWADLAQNDGSGPLTNLYVALHTADPSAGDQTTSEATYGGYARQAVVRTTSGWAAPSGGSTHNEGVIQFPECSGGNETITHVSIGTLVSGAGVILYSGALTTPRAISSGVVAQFLASALSVTES